MGDDSQGLDGMAVIVERFPHAHEYEIGQLLAWLELLACLDDLVDDLGRAQMASQSALGGQTKGAANATARLCRHTQGQTCRLPNQHALNHRPIVELIAQLARAIAGL